MKRTSGSDLRSKHGAKRKYSHHPLQKVLSSEGAKKFFATELQRVDEDNAEKVITQSEAHKINKLGIIELSDSDEEPKEIKKKVKTEKIKEEPVLRDKSTRVRKARDILDI